MYISLHICKYIYISIYVYVCVNVHMYMDVSIRIYVFVCVSKMIFYDAQSALNDDDDVYLKKLQREVLQNLISTCRMQTSQYGRSKENKHTNNKSFE
jgi:hypothetical protein